MPTLARRAAPYASHKSAWNKATDSSRSASPLVKRLLQNLDNLRLPPQQRCCDIDCSPVLCFLSAGLSVCPQDYQFVGAGSKMPAEPAHPAPTPPALYATASSTRSGRTDPEENEWSPASTWVAMGTRNDQVARQRMTLSATDPRPRPSPLSPPGATSL